MHSQKRKELVQTADWGSLSGVAEEKHGAECARGQVGVDEIFPYPKGRKWALTKRGGWEGKRKQCHPCAWSNSMWIHSFDPQNISRRQIGWISPIHSREKCSRWHSNLRWPCSRVCSLSQSSPHPGLYKKLKSTWKKSFPSKNISLIPKIPSALHSWHKHRLKLKWVTW